MRALRPLLSRHAVVSQPLLSSVARLSLSQVAWARTRLTLAQNATGRSLSTTTTTSTTTTRSVPFSSTAYLTTPPRRIATMAPYEEILKGKYPGKAHAKKVAEYIRSKIPNATGVVYVEAKKAKLHEDCDQEEHFRQRRSFYYLTGCNLPGCTYTYDIATDKATLYIPPVDPEDVIWSGLPLSKEEALEQYDVDDVKYTTDVNATLAHLGPTSKTIFAVPDQVSDNIAFLEFDDKNLSILKDAINYSRAIKTPYEIALMQKANNISSEGHTLVMKKVKHAANEAELHAVFTGHCTAHGARNMAYDVIAASGRAAATLHYVRNDQPLAGKLNLLMDAGCELDCYASDITRTYPVGGKFTPESRAIYDIVLRMQNESIDMLKEGVRWDDVHEHAHRVAIDGLLALGILKGDKEEIFKSRASVAFMPHGLGHYLGMDTHDTGGDPNYADKDSMFRYLRKRGTLPTGAVITVEPGLYFCKFIIDPALSDPATSKYIDASVLDKYWDVGGVRIEDNVVITPSGVDNLTSVVKDADELEKLISSS